VIGTAPAEGHNDRDDWIAAYEQMMRGEMRGNCGIATGSWRAADHAAAVIEAPAGGRPTTGARSSP
jgi:hypothetical protein